MEWLKKKDILLNRRRLENVQQNKQFVTGVNVLETTGRKWQNEMGFTYEEQKKC